jgi:hypothetical protein
MRSALRALAPLLTVFGLACQGDEPGESPSPADRPVTSSDLVGLVRARLVDLALTELRATKAFETSKAWADAEAERLDCRLEAGHPRACQRDAEAWADDVVRELLAEDAIAATTETRTTWAETIDLGMSPYPIEWTLSSPAPETVRVEVHLGGEATPAVTLRLGPAAASAEARLGAFQTLIDMSAAMDDLEDADLLESLAGTARWSLQLLGPRAVRASAEVEDLAFTLGFMNGDEMVLTSSGPFRVTARQDGEGRTASVETELPRATLTVPARVVQDDDQIRCDGPGAPCHPQATETLRVELFGARFSVTAAADRGRFTVRHEGPSGPWGTLDADGAEVGRAELGGFTAELETATREIFVAVSDTLSAELGFDVSGLGHIFEAPAGFDRETLDARFTGRVSIRTDGRSGDVVNVLRVLEGELVGEASEIADTIQVPAGQCLLAFDDARRGIDRDHPFAHLGAGACRP